MCDLIIDASRCGFVSMVERLMVASTPVLNTGPPQVVTIHIPIFLFVAHTGA